LRLGGNPIAGVGVDGAERQNLLELLQDAPQLETFSVDVARGAVGSTPANGGRYVVTNIPGMARGIAQCPSGPAGGPPDMYTCPFEIKTDWGVDSWSSGGLDLHFCLNVSDRLVERQLIAFYQLVADC
jgi:hypothetical protein